MIGTRGDECPHVAILALVVIDVAPKDRVFRVFYRALEPGGGTWPR